MSPNQIVDIKTLSAYRFERAKKELISAKLEKENNNYYAANNRAYYAIFHAVRSILALDNVDFMDVACCFPGIDERPPRQKTIGQYTKE